MVRLGPRLVESQLAGMLHVGGVKPGTATVDPNARAAAFAALERYFDRIFVLTIERAKDRQEKVRRALDGLRFEFFHGVDKLKLDPDRLEGDGLYDERRARRFHRHGKPMIIGHVACSLSHRELYREIARHRWPRVLVFEDDVIPIDSALPELPGTLAQLPGRWDVVWFGYRKHEVVTPQHRGKQLIYRLLAPLRLIKWTPREVSNMLPRPYSPNLRRAGLHDCTHAFALTPPAAQKLVDAQTPVALNCDLAISRLVLRGELEGFVTQPQFFDQDDPHSYVVG